MRTEEAPSPEPIATLVHTGPQPERLPEEELIRLVRRFAETPQLWRPLVQHLPTERWYRRLHRTGCFEVWLLGWDVAQDTQIHDHGGSSGALFVTEGTLVEYHSDRRRQGPMQHARHRRGGGRAFGPSYVHNLINEGPGVATSLHAYSPPLTTMSYYRRTVNQSLVLDHTLEVDGPEPSLLAAEGGLG